MSSEHSTPLQRLPDYTDEQLEAGVETLRLLREKLGEHLRDETLCGVVFDAMRASAPQSENTSINAAPQPSTANRATAPSQEGVGQRDAAAAAPLHKPANGSWVEVEKAKADAYEAAARICEEMSYPPDGQERWHGTDNEWAAIKLEDAAKSIRERKAKVCHVTQAVK